MLWFSEGATTYSTLTVILLFLIESLEGYHPLIQLPVAPYVHYTTPLLFPINPPLIQSHQQNQHEAPLQVAADSNPNVVRVLVHKEFQRQPNGEYRDISGETTKIIAPEGGSKEIEKYSERETRRIKPTNLNVGSSYFDASNRFSQNKATASKDFQLKESTKESQGIFESHKEDQADYTNSEGGYGKGGESEEDTNSDESSEEVADDRNSQQTPKKGNIKKDLQRDFFRSPDEELTSDEEHKDEVEEHKDEDEERKYEDDESKYEDEEGKYEVEEQKDEEEESPTVSTPGINIELLHTLSKQFLLKNGQLTQLNSSDFTLMKNENDKPTGYYNYNIDEKSESNPDYSGNYNSSESTEPLHSSEEIDTSANTDNQRYLKENEKPEEQEQTNAFQKVVQSLIQRQILQVQQQRESEQKQKVPIQSNYGGKQILQAPKPTFVSEVKNYNRNVNDNYLNLNDTRSQNLMRQKLNLVQQIQSQNREKFNSSYSSYDARNSKVASPSLGYSGHSMTQQQQAEADELRVFLFDAPRYSSLNSPNPTQQTFNAIPASYTRRPLKLTTQPLFKSHYDRTLYKNVGNTISTRPTKQSRTLNNNEWIPVTSRSIVPSPVPEKLRQISSLRTGKTNGITSKAQLQSSFATNNIKGSIKSAENHPVSIQDIIRNQKDVSGSGSTEEGINNNQSGENTNSNGPLFSLIDELTGVIEKHKNAATSSEEVLPKSNPQSSSRFTNEKLFSTQTPPQIPIFRNNEPRTKINNNFPVPNGNTNINQLENVAPSQNTTSTNQIQPTISNATINNSNQNKKENLYYYTGDMRGTSTTPSSALASGLVKTMMAVPPYIPYRVQENQRNKAKSPVHAFLNSLHALHEKNKNRHSHVHEFLKNSLNLRKSKNNAPSENLPNTRGNKLTPSIYSAVPVYRIEQIPVSQFPFPDVNERKRPQFSVASINPEVEVLNPVGIDGETPTHQEFSQSHLLSDLGTSPPQDSKRKPKEYLGDKYARLGENLFYRVHHIFKQFVPPVLHVGANEPPKL